MTFTISTFYRFVKLPDYERIREEMLFFCKKTGLKGTILIANEGINATIAGTKEQIEKFFYYLDKDKKLADMEWKASYSEFQPFGKMKVRLKKEIVRMAVDELDIDKRGEYIEAKDWDQFISDPEVIVIDTRNDYEVQLGKFSKAINPKTAIFRKFPEWVQENLIKEKNKKIAMYCTGGIRCEKSTSLLKNMGFNQVYHLKGGILKYLEDTENKNNMWQGDCFVFDERIAVNDKLEPVPEDNWIITIKRKQAKSGVV